MPESQILIYNLLEALILFYKGATSFFYLLLQNSVSSLTDWQAILHADPDSNYFLGVLKSVNDCAGPAQPQDQL